MNAHGFRLLFDYHYATYARIWAPIEKLDEASFGTAPGYSIGSLRDHLVHQMSVDRGWLTLLRGAPRAPHLDPAGTDLPGAG